MRRSSFRHPRARLAFPSRWATGCKFSTNAFSPAMRVKNSAPMNSKVNFLSVTGSVESGASSFAFASCHSLIFLHRRPDALGSFSRVRIGATRTSDSELFGVSASPESRPLLTRPADSPYAANEDLSSTGSQNLDVQCGLRSLFRASARPGFYPRNPGILWPRPAIVGLHMRSLF